MKSNSCTTCHKDFGFFRWRYVCECCKAPTCDDCLSLNFKKQRVCNNCHFCSKCNSKVHKSKTSYCNGQIVCDDCHFCRKCNIKTSRGEEICDNCHTCDHCHAHCPKSSMTHTTINPTKSNPLGVQYWCKNCNDTYLDNVRNWITGTKNETLRNCIIVKEIGLFRISDRCNDPAEVESKLKNEILFKGGNSFIKFFWDKHIEHHDEKYIAGYGHNGNPYYKTRHFTVQYFTGTAIGVLTKKPKSQVQSKDESETPATHTTDENKQSTRKYRSRFSVASSK